MTNETTTPASAETTSPLLFNGVPIAFALFDGTPFYALDDLCAAMNWNAYAAECVGRPNFPAHAKRIVEEQGEDGSWHPVTLLSPVGVFLWGHDRDAARTQSIAAWAKREAIRINPDAKPDDPAVFLSLMPNGELPPMPMKFSGRRSEWFDLRDSGAHLRAKAETQTAALKQRSAAFRELLETAEADRLAKEAAKVEG